MKILDSFYKLGSFGYVQLAKTERPVLHNKRYIVGWELYERRGYTRYYFKTLHSAKKFFAEMRRRET